MHHFSLLLLAGCILPGLAAAAAPARDRQQFDDGWRFRLGDEPAASQQTFDDGAWRNVDLPHDWSIEAPVDHAAPGAGAIGFFPSGTGWYRRHFTAPAALADRRVLVEFEGVYMNAEVWINGHRVGAHPYGYTPFSCDLTAHVIPGGENVLAVRVDNSAQPNCRWYSGSGIYRHVWLEIASPVRIADGGVFLATTALTDKEATVRIEAVVHNGTAAPASTEIETHILSPAGKAVARASAPVHVDPSSEAHVTYSVTIPQPQPWSPETPALYRAATSVRTDKRVVIDEVQTPFGVRTVRVSAGRGFELNGRPIKLLGGSLHHDNGPLGAAAFDRAEERRVALLKAAGFNALRTSHNPPSPAFLDACDRLGMLVMDEAFDGWAKAKNPHDYSVVFKDWWPRDLDSMVLRDRNHPSVVLWSIGNEVFERGSPSGALIAKSMAARIRDLDATRPVTAGLNDLGEHGDWTKLDPLFAELDLAGYNYRLQSHAADHARLPARAIVATESYQSETFANWAVANDNAYVAGDFVWSALDYLGEAGIGGAFPPDKPAVKHWEGDQFPWHGAYCGDVDITGWRKPVSHYRNIVWDRGETLYAAVSAPTPDGRPWNLTPWAMPPALPSWTWPGSEGRSLAVEVYSRNDAVRLYLNGSLIGEKPTTRAEQFKAVFSVPYAPGTLKAVGLRNGREAETFAIETADRASRIRLAADRTAVNADGQDLAFVTVEVTDRQGRLRPDADQALRFAVTGPAAIVAIGTGDMVSRETYQANPHRVFQGRAVVVLRATRAPGAIKLTAESPDIGSATLKLKSVPVK